mgnify:CR=1 FL=1
MSELKRLRRQKDEFFAHDSHSPLSAEQKRTFPGLRYFPENSQLRFQDEVKRSTAEQVVHMQTNTGELREYHKYGTFGFLVNGDSAELCVYTSGDRGFFVPFADATSGQETYGAGRYVEVHSLGGERFEVDFNQAYNPWCAYSPNFSCPISPAENRLTIPIRAGEQSFGA